MSNEMSIVLNPKYESFIKIIDNYKTEEKITNESNKSNESVESGKSNNLLIDLTKTNDLVSKSSNPNKFLDMDEKIINVSEKDDINNIQSEKINEDDYRILNETNNVEISSTQDIFKKLHLLISSKNKIHVNPNSMNNNINTNNSNNSNILNNNNDNVNNSPKQININKENDNSENSIDNYIKKEKNKKKSSKKKNNKDEDEDENTQIKKLELLYENKINNNSGSKNDQNNGSNKLEKLLKSDNSNKKPQYKDNLKKICKQFEEKCIMESTRGFNIKDDLYYISMDVLRKNIAQFNSSISTDYECLIFYRNFKDNRIVFNPDKKVGWMEITKSGERNINSKNKYLSSSLRLFETTDKFRKTINGTKVRAFKNSFYIYKTNIKIDVLAITKEVIN